MQLKTGWKRVAAAALSLVLVFSLQTGVRAADSGALSALPNSTGSAAADWAAAVGETGAMVSNETTNAVVIGDSVYVAGGGLLKKVRAADGTVTAVSAESAQCGWNYFLTTGKAAGKTAVFMTETVFDSSYQANMVVKAFDTDLNLIWKSAVFTGYSGCYSPVVYNEDSGMVFGALNEASDSFFALSAQDGSTVWTADAPCSAAISSSYGTYWSSGGYWTSPAFVGNYVVYGSEGGHVLVYRAKTGELVSEADASSSESTCIRSGMTYESGALFFTSNDGYVHKMTIHAQTGALGSDLKTKLSSDADNATSTPAVYGGRVYATGGAGADGILTVLSEDTLSVIYSVKTSDTGKLYDVKLFADPNNSKRVYGFATYQASPGSFIRFADQSGQTASSGVTNYGSLTRGSAEQYCAAQLAYGSDGTLYLTNDSGKLVKVSGTLLSPAAVSESGGSSVSGISVSLGSGFSSEKFRGILKESVDSFGSAELKLAYADAVAAGKNISLQLSVSPVTSEDADDLALAQAALEKSNAASDAVYFNLTVYVLADENPIGTLSELSEDIPISIAPQNAQSGNYMLVRVHDGSAKTMKTGTLTNGAFTAGSSRFSVYGLGKVESASQSGSQSGTTGTTAATVSPKTGDGFFTLLWNRILEIL